MEAARLGRLPLLQRRRPWPAEDTPAVRGEGVGRA